MRCIANWSLCGKYTADFYLLGVITLRQEIPLNEAAMTKKIAVFTNDDVMIARNHYEGNLPDTRYSSGSRCKTRISQFFLFFNVFCGMCIIKSVNSYVIKPR